MDGLPGTVVAAPVGDWEAVVATGGALRLRHGDTVVPVAEEVLHQLAWTADGDRLAYAARQPRTDADLWLVDLPSTTPRQLTDWIGSEDRPAFSPDGGQLAFVSGRTGLASVWVLDLESGASRQLTNVGLAHQPKPPVGFVPPPRTTLSWSAEGLSWQAQGRTWQVTP